jgi:hypothetical protein
MSRTDEKYMNVFVSFRICGAEENFLENGHSFEIHMAKAVFRIICHISAISETLIKRYVNMSMEVEELTALTF